VAQDIGPEFKSLYWKEGRKERKGKERKKERKEKKNGSHSSVFHEFISKDSRHQTEKE
jgi:hypothetical protein